MSFSMIFASLTVGVAALLIGILAQLGQWPGDDDRYLRSVISPRVYYATYQQVELFNQDGRLSSARPLATAPRLWTIDPELLLVIVHYNNEYVYALMNPRNGSLYKVSRGFEQAGRAEQLLFGGRFLRSCRFDTRATDCFVVQLPGGSAERGVAHEGNWPTEYRGIHSGYQQQYSEFHAGVGATVYEHLVISTRPQRRAYLLPSPSGQWVAVAYEQLWPHLQEFILADREGHNQRLLAGAVDREAAAILIEHWRQVPSGISPDGLWCATPYASTRVAIRHEPGLASIGGERAKCKNVETWWAADSSAYCYLNDNGIVLARLNGSRRQLVVGAGAELLGWVGRNILYASP